MNAPHSGHLRNFFLAPTSEALFLPLVARVI
jgi:hypothetical protein